MPNYNLPASPRLNETLDMIVGNGVSAKEEGSLDLAGASHFAVFVNRQDETVAYALCDLPVAAALGAALSMVPPGAAEDMVAEKELTEAATANLYEVMNIFSALYMDDDTDHLRLTEVKPANDPSYAELSDSKSTTYTIDVGRYGSGLVHFISAT
ncbi:MAG: hypothetical protein AAGA11_04755 [Pseudomonadota bacterium]